MNMTPSITKGIKISVTPKYSGIQKHNNSEYFLFEYKIYIENQSPNTVKLNSRHWEIYDSLNNTEIVDGQGVVGQQPILNSGEKYTYTSFCPLISNCGSMKGYYTMYNYNTESYFRVTIPTFQLQTTCFSN